MSGGLVSGGTVTGGQITGGTVSGAVISGGTVLGGYISGGTVTGVSIFAVGGGGTISPAYITFGTIGQMYITSGTTDNQVIGQFNMYQHTTPETTNTWDLGNTTRGWRYLYLHDGTDEWRIQINTSGVLTTTKV